MTMTSATSSAPTHEALQRYVDNGSVSGVVYESWHNGTRIDAGAIGLRNLEQNLPMTMATRFRVASMTKVVTSVAALILIDEGKLSLADPITQWVPELANRRVLCDAEGALDDTVAAARAITVEDLLTHRSGLAYGFASAGPIAGAYFAALGAPGKASLPSDGFIAALATLPLSYQPGERMNYSHSTDVLGVLIERIEGARLGTVLQNRILDPLGMTGTGFFVPETEQDQVAVVYGFDDNAGKLVKSDWSVPSAPPILDAGGDGLVSTAPDFARLALMLLGEGQLQGRRLLRPETVREMRANHLTPVQRQFPFVGRPVWEGMGFGLGVAIIEDPAKSLLGYGAPGAFSWPGAWGTWWQADPKNELVMVYMIAHEIPLTADSGAVLAGGRGYQGRMSLEAYQKRAYERIDGSV